MRSKFSTKDLSIFRYFKSIITFYFSPQYIRLRKVVRVSFIRDKHYENLYHPTKVHGLVGISERYINQEQAEADSAKFTNSFFKTLVLQQTKKHDVDMRNATVLDICSGAGGSTVIPILLECPTCFVFASDLSQAMLRELCKRAKENDVHNRVDALVCDAQKNIWRNDFADLVVGGAALHHLADVNVALASCLKTLKPGGIAVFLEPMESGHHLLAEGIKKMLALPSLSNIKYKTTKSFLNNLVRDIDVRSQQIDPSESFSWYDLDDKWLFKRSHLEAVAAAQRCTVTIESMHSSIKPLSKHLKVALEEYADLSFPECCPSDALEIFDDFESQFSEADHSDNPLEAVIVFQKRRS